VTIVGSSEACVRCSAKVDNGGTFGFHRSLFWAETGTGKRVKLRAPITSDLNRARNGHLLGVNCAQSPIFCIAQSSFLCSRKGAGSLRATQPCASPWILNPANGGTIVPATK